MFYEPEQILLQIYRDNVNVDALLLLTTVYNRYQTNIKFKDLYLFVLDYFEGNEYEIHVKTAKLFYKYGLYGLAWESFNRAKYENIENNEEHYILGSEM